jgi:hypothetical protein
VEHGGAGDARGPEEPDALPGDVLTTPFAPGLEIPVDDALGPASPDESPAPAPEPDKTDA